MINERIKAHGSHQRGLRPKLYLYLKKIQTYIYINLAYS